MANDTIVHYHELGNDKLDNIITAVSIILGIPANLLIFLTFRSFPSSASKFLFRLLAIFDLISLVLLFTQRPLMWFDILQFENKRTTAFLTIYLNVIYYISIFANMILVTIGLERLLYTNYPTSYIQYFGNLDRVKLTLIIKGLLIMSFCLIITIKMSYFGLAWTVIFLTFYVVIPSICLLTCVLLLAYHYFKKYQERKFMEKNKTLTASNASIIEGSPSHHSGISASGPLKGSTSSSIAFKGGRKKDPYSLYLVEKSASESHLSATTSPKHSNALTKSKSGHCVNTVVSLKVPDNARASYQSIHKNIGKGDYLTQEQEEQLRLKKTRNKQLTIMTVAVSIVLILGCFPLTGFSATLMKEDLKDFDLSDKYTYIMIMSIMITMYVIHSTKFFFYFAISSMFRRHVFALFTCRQQSLTEAEASTSAH